MTVNIDSRTKRRYRNGTCFGEIAELFVCNTLPLIITVRISGPVTLFPSVTVILRSYPVVVKLEISWSSCILPAVNENDVNV